jgi:hypothetical protein
MIRILVVALSLILAFHGLAFGQGIMESILGAGWTGFGQSQNNIVNRFTSPMFYGGSYDPSRMTYRQPGAPGQQGQAGQQSYNYSFTPPSTPGIYPDWQGGRPGPTAPPVTYSTPPPARYTAPPRQRTRAPAPQGTARQAPVRPGQYSPRQGPRDVDQLPSGAVQVTTTTPQGTMVQYYAPPGETPAGPMPTYRERRPLPRRATSRAKPRTTAPQATVEDTRGQPTGIAMPRPVEIPSGADPRSGWRAR